MDNTIISGNINIVGGCAIAFTVNGHSVVNSSGAGQVNQDITSFLVKGTNTISIMTSFGTTSSGGPCICNPGFGTITECFGLDYKICTNVIQPTPNPSQTPNPSPSGTMTPPTITPTGTLTPTISPTLTVTGTQTVSPSVTVSETITETVSPTTSITDTPTATVTDTQTSNATDTPTSTPTVTDTPTASPTATPGCVAGNYSQPVTRYAQQDPTWANTELDHSTDPVETIGHRGCFLTSMGMIAGDDPATTNQIFTNSTPAGVISTGDLDSTAGADDLG
ncbi:MAG TPA: hypothetical protein VJ873_07270, partial [bacterium]|nr:hypothetical protein [bacterium]